MQKTVAYAFMLAATLGLAACDKPSEDTREDAREAQAEARESMKDAAKHSNEAANLEAEAARERAEENREEAEEANGQRNTFPTPPAPANQTNQ